jgi:hypothetical protein
MKLAKVKIYNEKISKFLFNLRNKDYVRKNSINIKKINFFNHEKWFKNFLKKKNILYLIKEKNISVGYIRLEKLKGFFLVSWAILKKFQKKGYAKKSVMLSTNNKKFKYKALVKKDNEISKYIVAKAKFKKKYSKKNIVYYSK